MKTFFIIAGTFALSMVFTYFLMKKHMKLQHGDSETNLLSNDGGDKETISETLADLLSEVGVELK